MSQRVISVRIDDRQIRKWVSSLPIKLKINNKQAIQSSINKIMRTAKFLAPHQTGELRKGIMLGKRTSGKYVERAEINWKELSSKRQRSFNKSAWNGNFVEWMHKSPNARIGKFHWKTGIPNFFDKALQLSRNGVIKQIEQAIDKSIK